MNPEQRLTPDEVSEITRIAGESAQRLRPSSDFERFLEYLKMRQMKADEVLRTSKDNAARDRAQGAWGELQNALEFVHNASRKADTSRRSRPF